MFLANLDFQHFFPCLIPCPSGHLSALSHLQPPCVSAVVISSCSTPARVLDAPVPPPTPYSPRCSFRMPLSSVFTLARPSSPPSSWQCIGWPLLNPALPAFGRLHVT